MDTVQFFLPRAYWPGAPLPWSPDDPLLYPEGQLTHTLQTYLRLKAIGYPCVLVDELPSEGLVVAHRSAVAEAAFSPDVFLVNLLADRGPHRWAQAVVVQNPRQARRRGHTLIPQWPQPGLVPRDAKRGDRFEAVAYFGREENLAPTLRDAPWRAALEMRGLSWQVVDHPRNDYSEVDAVIAARDFLASSSYDFKPAAKLVNAWVAGVVPLVAPEPAHLALRTSDLDFITVCSADDALAALDRLRGDPDIRQRMVARGQERARSFTTESITETWRRYLDEVAWPSHREWMRRGRAARWAYYARRSVRWPFDVWDRRRVKKHWSG